MHSTRRWQIGGNENSYDGAGEQKRVEKKVAVDDKLTRIPINAAATLCALPGAALLSHGIATPKNRQKNLCEHPRVCHTVPICDPRGMPEHLAAGSTGLCTLSSNVN